MNRSRTALLAAVAGAALLAGCGASEASQSKVQDQVEEQLLENGYRGEDVDATQAAAAAACVAQTMFESANFTKDERNEVARAGDGDEPSDELVAKVVELVDGCVTGAATAGPAAPGGDEETTTTEGD